MKSVIFNQSSSQIVTEGTKDLEITCSHNDSSLSTMLWYQHKQSSRSMSLIGYTVVRGDPVYESQFKDRFKLERKEVFRGSLIIGTVSESAVYYCAASTQ